ncbi:hypothetical protein KCTC52924_00714 [Arenibacter antarcticus]|uniref:Phosphodiester glycosidase family protein n=1 Tax=Arenibacter antarcticus TaxID=2040469 RepID=A0ABW5VCZ6_9FLAO|nr:phosphodiester glycosidase family protein [Arenibacter sp. H213]MCM4169225.1 hypothetical protein [Arenibacter sp. H213]
MRKYLIVSLLLAACFMGCSQDGQSAITEPPEVQIPKTDIEIISSAEWIIKEVSDEVVWKYFHFDKLFSSKQSVTVIEISAVPNVVSADIQYVESGFLKTSDAAVNTGAIAAINGSFFNTTNGGSTVFLKKDGNVINETRSGFDSHRENGGFGINSLGEVSINEKPVSGWEDVNVETLLVSGPLLMKNGEDIVRGINKFNDNRHPRTAIGITADKRVLAVVVDGRASQAHGVSIAELATIMKALGCEDALNLDGGGSSTAWVKNYGVVNYPTDNKKFDHEGERGVATVLTFLQNK